MLRRRCTESVCVRPTDRARCREARCPSPLRGRCLLVFCTQAPLDSTCRFVVCKTNISSSSSTSNPQQFVVADSKFWNREEICQLIYNLETQTDQIFVLSLQNVFDGHVTRGPGVKLGELCPGPGLKPPRLDMSRFSGVVRCLTNNYVIKWINGVWALNCAPFFVATFPHLQTLVPVRSCFI